MSFLFSNSPSQSLRYKRFTVARVLIGLLLLVAAGLKIHGLTQSSLARGPLSLGPLSEGSFLSSPRLQIAAIEVEIVVGIWLLWGGYARAAWWVAAGFFALLGGASAYLGFAGQSSCGCFGVIPVSPWVTFGLDVGVLAVWPY